MLPLVEAVLAQPGRGLPEKDEPLEALEVHVAGERARAGLLLPVAQGRLLDGDVSLAQTSSTVAAFEVDLALVQPGPVQSRLARGEQPLAHVQGGLAAVKDGLAPVQGGLPLVGGQFPGLGEAVLLVGDTCPGRQVVPLVAQPFLAKADATLAGLQIDLSLGCGSLVRVQASLPRHASIVRAGTAAATLDPQASRPPARTGGPSAACPACVAREAGRLEGPPRKTSPTSGGGRHGKQWLRRVGPAAGDTGRPCDGGVECHPAALLGAVVARQGLVLAAVVRRLHSPGHPLRLLG
jgi:hypothetical protein